MNWNRLTGEIPRELCGIESLTGFGVFGNKLTGEIPPEIGNLTRLDRLSLDGNEFTGEIPIGITKLTSLKRLWLHNNQLSGRIPPEIGNLRSLTTLFLGDNQLSGSIPRELASLPKLELLSLGGNPQLEGDRAILSPQIEGRRKTWNVFDLAAHVLPEDSGVGLLRGSQDDDRSVDDAGSPPSDSSAAALHLFAIAPVELYRASIAEAVRERFSETSGWAVDESSELSESIQNIIARLSLTQSGPVYTTEEQMPTTGDSVTIRAIFLETGVCLVFHTTSRLTTCAAGGPCHYPKLRPSGLKNMSPSTRRVPCIGQCGSGSTDGIASDGGQMPFTTAPSASPTKSCPSPPTSRVRRPEHTIRHPPETIVGCRVRPLT